MKQLQGTPLKRFLRDFRRDNPNTLDIVLILESVTYPANVGSLFRIADAAQLTSMILCNATPIPNKTIAKVGRNKHEQLDWYYEKNTVDALKAVSYEGYHVCALEITDQSVPYFDFTYPEKIAFVIGNEDHGVTRAALAHCQSSVFVPMYGKGRSLNVHVSASIVLFHAIQSHLRS